MNRIPEPSRLLQVATAAARTAGDHAFRNFHRRGQVVQVFRHDVKLRLDLECQAKAEGEIRRRFPDHDILGEESGRREAVSDQPAGFQWIIDPIDGTVNFTHGLRNWCCSVAVTYRGEVIAGAVYAPALAELYQATVATRSVLNGRRIAVSRVGALTRSMVMTGTDKNATSRHRLLAFFTRITLGTQKVRVAGSAAMDLCQVACGRAEGYFETGIYIWDVAAAGLIVRRAGGRTEELAKLDREHRLTFLATNGRIHRALKTVIGFR
jgi:myo-inositol-1(or 4)-monophosphatase